MLARLFTSPRLLLLMALLFLLGAAAWLTSAGDEAAPPVSATVVDRLHSRAVASMDSPVFAFERGWQVSASGADTTEPDQPWAQPSGRMAFQYSGRELALQLALGDYWGYVFVTVDGRPANRLPVLRGNLDSLGQLSGYRPLFSPEKQTPRRPGIRMGRCPPCPLATAPTRSRSRFGGVGARLSCAQSQWTRCPPALIRSGPRVLLTLIGGWLAVAALGAVYWRCFGDEIRV